ncbi:MAG: DUF3987 domain-containing protein [Planctomycetota bacterium]
MTAVELAAEEAARAGCHAYVTRQQTEADALRSIGLAAHWRGDPLLQLELLGQPDVVLCGFDDIPLNWLDGIGRIHHYPPEAETVDGWLGGLQRSDPEELRALFLLSVSAYSLLISEPATAITRRISAQPTFPTDALPPRVAGFVRSSAKAVGVDEAVVGSCALGALSTAVVASRCLRIKTGWREFPILWVGVVGPSGCGKSPALALAVGPLRRRDALLAQQTQVEVRRRREVARQQQGRGRDNDPPPVRAALLGDATVEAVAARLQDNPRGLGLVADELTTWFGGFDRYSQGKSDAARWLSMHSGETLRVDRKTGDVPTLLIRRAAMAIVGGIQPGVIDRTIGKGELESGMAQRFLLAAPPMQAQPWSDHQVPEAALTAYARTIDSLLNLELDAGGEPPELHLTKGAHVVFKRWYDCIAVEMNETDNPHLQSALAKLRGGGVLRIALLVALAHAAEDEAAERLLTVDAVDMEAAVQLASYYLGQARAMYGRWATSEPAARRGSDRRKEKVLDAIRAAGDAGLRVTDIQRTVLNRNVAMEAVEHMLLEMEQDGQVEPRMADRTDVLGTPAKCWVAVSNPTTTTTTTTRNTAAP